MEEVEFKQRAYDGKWEMIKKIIDHDNTVVYETDSGNTITLTSEKWVTVKVYDYLMTLED